MSCKDQRIIEVADILRVSHENRACQNLWFLAKTKGQSISISSTYIVFITKMQKRANPAK